MKKEILKKLVMSSIEVHCNKNIDNPNYSIDLSSSYFIPQPYLNKICDGIAIVKSEIHQDSMEEKEILLCKFDDEFNQNGRVHISSSLKSNFKFLCGIENAIEKEFGNEYIETDYHCGGYILLEPKIK